jgi:hypothetical protein
VSDRRQSVIVVLSDPDDPRYRDPDGSLPRRSRGGAEPPLNDETRRAVAAYRELVDAYGQDRLGLPKPGRRHLLTVVCETPNREPHRLGRVFRVGRKALFVGAIDLSRGSAKQSDGRVLATIAYIKVVARFLDAQSDDEEYPVKCLCRPTVWLGRARLSAALNSGDRVIPASAVLTRYDTG